jgi:hypothetical protein
MPMIPDMTPAQVERIRTDRETRARLGKALHRDVEPQPLPRNAAPIAGVSKIAVRPVHAPVAVAEPISDGLRPDLGRTADGPRIIPHGIFVAKRQDFEFGVRAPGPQTIPEIRKCLFDELPLEAHGWKPNAIRISEIGPNKFRAERR